MASLRDVLNHIGQGVSVERQGRRIGEAKATRRGALVLLEPKVEPRTDDTVRFTATGEAFRVVSVAAERHLETLDHYRLEVAPA